MTMIPTCVVCDGRVANIYAPDALCERCKLPCPTCDGDVAHCQHPLPTDLQVIEAIASARSNRTGRDYDECLVEVRAEQGEQIVEVEHLGEGRIAA